MGHGDDRREHGANVVRWFGVLGTIVFVGGWAATVYVAFLRGDASFPDETAYNVQILVSLGSAVTLAAGVLWAIAAYVWVQLTRT